MLKAMPLVGGRIRNRSRSCVWVCVLGFSKSHGCPRGHSRHAAHRAPAPGRRHWALAKRWEPRTGEGNADGNRSRQTLPYLRV